MYIAQFKIIPGIWYNVCLTDFLKKWPLQGFRPLLGTARLQTNAVSKGACVCYRLSLIYDNQGDFFPKML